MKGLKQNMFVIMCLGYSPNAELLLIMLHEVGLVPSLCSLVPLCGQNMHHKKKEGWKQTGDLIPPPPPPPLYGITSIALI